MGSKCSENYFDASCGFGVVTVCKTVMTVADELYRSVTSLGLGLKISNTDTNNGSKKKHTYFPLKSLTIVVLSLDTLKMYKQD